MSLRSMFPLMALAGIVLTGSLPAAQPNIIFILCDDLGHGDVGVFFQKQRQAANVRSEPWHFTPRLDTLAAEGAQLPRHYAPAPVCAPSRASLLLGVHQGHANVRDNQFDKALADNHTLATVLKQAGYATAAIGKWGLQGGGGSPAAWPAYPTKRGFDFFHGYVRHGDGHTHYPFHTTQSRPPKELYENAAEISGQLENCYTTDLFTARAKRWIQDHRAANPSQPFFMYLAYDTPHAATQIPTVAYPAGGGTNGGLQWLSTSGQMINTATGAIDSYYHPDYVAATWDHDNNLGTPEVVWPDIYQRYATMVRRIDDGVGDLMTLLKQLQIDTNTIIVFTTDNGPSKESYLPEDYVPDFFNSFGPHDGIKRDLWEGGVRVGALVRWPGTVLSNQVYQTPSGFPDWMPTFAQAAGVTAPARSDGVSLLPLLTGQGTQRPPLVYLEYFQGDTTPNYTEFHPSHRNRTRRQMQALYHDGYKGVRYNITAATNLFEIYDTLTDPHETNNLALQPAFAALQQRMQDRALQVRRPDASAARPYDSAPVPASTNTMFTNGVVNYATYTGDWHWVPEFAALNTVSTGRVAGLNLAVRPQATNYGIAFTGYITVPAEGDYTFYGVSDAGMHFRIHDATVLDDDFKRTGAEVSGTIRLKAGRHPFRLYYRHGTGAELLRLQYSGPCLEKQPVPLAAFSLAGSADPRPQAVNDCIRTAQNTAVLIPVLANDTDDGLPGPLTVVSVTSPQAGTATVQGGQVLYTPNAEFLGEDTFSYSASDGQHTAVATVNVSVFFSTNQIWFPFNQTSGLETEEAGGGIVATLTGYASDTEPWVVGRWNRGVQLDGATQFATINGYTPPFGTSARTTAAWLKTTGTGSILAWGPNTTSLKWMMRLESATTATGALRLEVGGGSVVGTRDLRDDQWHHVAAVLPALAAPNATNVLLYVDGTLEPLSSRSASSINTAAATVTVGTDAQGRFFSGIIDEVRVYPRALSAVEISALYNGTNQSTAAWHWRHFGTEAGDWQADDDGDRGARLLEYALGGQPHIADATRLSLTAEISRDWLRVSYPRRLAGTHELTYALQSSSDLGQWSTNGVSEIAVEADGLDGFERVTAQADAAVWQQSPFYLRLAIGVP